MPVIRSKFAGWCSRCNAAFPVGAEIDWVPERAEKTLCMSCSAGTPPAEAPPVVADGEDLPF